MKNLVVEPGTMLYDVDAQMLGWVVGKHQWEKGYTSDMYVGQDWDIEWSNGKQEHYDGRSLQYFIKAYIMLEEDNDKR